MYTFLSHTNNSAISTLPPNSRVMHGFSLHAAVPSNEIKAELCTDLNKLARGGENVCYLLVDSVQMYSDLAADLQNHLIQLAESAQNYKGLADYCKGTLNKLTKSEILKWSDLIEDDVPELVEYQKQCATLSEEERPLQLTALILKKRFGISFEEKTLKSQDIELFTADNTSMLAIRLGIAKLYCELDQKYREVVEKSALTYLNRSPKVKSERARGDHFKEFDPKNARHLASLLYVLEECAGTIKILWEQKKIGKPISHFDYKAQPHLAMIYILEKENKVAEALNLEDLKMPEFIISEKRPLSTLQEGAKKIPGNAVAQNGMFRDTPQSAEIYLKSLRTAADLGAGLKQLDEITNIFAQLNAQEQLQPQ